MITIWKNTKTGELGLGGSAKFVGSYFTRCIYRADGKAHIAQFDNLADQVDRRGKWEQVFTSQHYNVRHVAEVCTKCNRQHPEEHL